MCFGHTFATIYFIRGKILSSINWDEIEMLPISMYKFKLLQFFTSLNNFKEMLKEGGEMKVGNIINNGPHLGIRGDHVDTKKSC